MSSGHVPPGEKETGLVTSEQILLQKASLGSSRSRAPPRSLHDNRQFQTVRPPVTRGCQDFALLFHFCKQLSSLRLGGSHLSEKPPSSSSHRTVQPKGQRRGQRLTWVGAGTVGAGERMDGVHRQGCAWGRGGKQGSPFPAAAPSRLLKGLKDLSSYAYQAPCPCIARKFFKRGGEGVHISRGQSFILGRGKGSGAGRRGRWDRSVNALAPQS